MELARKLLADANANLWRFTGRDVGGTYHYNGGYDSWSQCGVNAGTSYQLGTC